MNKAMKEDIVTFIVLALIFGGLFLIGMPQNLAFTMFVGAGASLAVSNYYARKRAKKLAELTARAEAIGVQLEQLRINMPPEVSDAVQHLRLETARLQATLQGKY